MLLYSCPLGKVGDMGGVAIAPDDADEAPDKRDAHDDVDRRTAAPPCPPCRLLYCSMNNETHGIVRDPSL